MNFQWKALPVFAYWENSKCVYFKDTKILTPKCFEYFPYVFLILLLLLFCMKKKENHTQLKNMPGKRDHIGDIWDGNKLRKTCDGESSLLYFIVIKLRRVVNLFIKKET